MEEKPLIRRKSKRDSEKNLREKQSEQEQTVRDVKMNLMYEGGAGS